MPSRRRVWTALASAFLVVVTGVSGVTGTSAARADQPAAGPPGCPYTGYRYADCVQAPVNDTDPITAPAVTWTPNANDTITGRFTATISPAYTTCVTTGNYPASELPCELQGQLQASVRQYIPGPNLAVYDGIDLEQVSGGTCTLTSCDL